LNCSLNDVYDRNEAALFKGLEGYAEITKVTNCLLPCKRNVYSAKKITTLDLSSMNKNTLMQESEGKTVLFVMIEQTKTMTR
jgi:hypothetical protein